MDNTSAKINLKIGEIEISIEGSSDFVSEQYDKIENHLKSYSELSEKLIKNKPKKTIEQEKKVNEESQSENAENSELPETFGEWLSLLKKGTSDTDKALLAGYFNQVKSEGNIFKVREVTADLKEHGVKLANPSNLIKNATKGKKFIFQFSKDGKQANYRFSRDGESYMKGLLVGSSE
jgi:hypothetical protein